MTEPSASVGYTLWHLRVTAHALAASGTLATLSTGLTLVGAGGVALLALVGRDGSLPAAGFATIIVLGLYAQWISLRVRLDARLFDAAARAESMRELQTAEIDRALVELSMLPPAKAGRDWPLRCAGAFGLVRTLGWVTAAQALIFVLIAIALALR